MNGIDTKSIVDWLVDGARSAPLPQDVLADLCDRLVRLGIPLWRVGVFVRTLHPQIMGRRFLWRPGEEVAVSDAPYETMKADDFLRSPVVHVYGTGKPLRRRLVDPDCPIDFPVLREFQEEKITDYLASPLIFTNGEIHVATWSTREADGFSDAEVAAIETVVAPLARVAEVRALRRTAVNLLDTYVGREAGERILSGKIRRGDTDVIHAAIWLSDMRGFTALADRLPSETLMGLLNGYFDCQVPAIVEHGGEVLKFMGDGLLAIFRIGESEKDARKVCGCALAAARAARAKVTDLAASPAISGGESVRFGLGLHIGEVLYGNIGAGNRLDFTCIGPAVNLAARLEALAGRLGRVIVASAAFASRCGGGLELIGEFSLPGFTAAQKAFGLAEEGRPSAS